MIGCHAQSTHTKSFGGEIITVEERTSVFKWIPNVVLTSPEIFAIFLLYVHVSDPTKHFLSEVNVDIERMLSLMNLEKLELSAAITDSLDKKMVSHDLRLSKLHPIN